MTAKDVLRATMDMGQMVLTTYLSDLADADLMTRPGPGSNHLAWQLGHLINSERHLVESVVPGCSPPLPKGFSAHHDKSTGNVDDPSKFLRKQEYLDLLAKQRKATMDALDRLGDGDLDKPGPKEFARLCPTVMATFNLVGNHMMMHAGQFAAARRMLGKPVLI